MNKVSSNNNTEENTMEIDDTFVAARLGSNNEGTALKHNFNIPKQKSNVIFDDKFGSDEDEFDIFVKARLHQLETSREDTNLKHCETESIFLNTVNLSHGIQRVKSSKNDSNVKYENVIGNIDNKIEEKSFNAITNDIKKGTPISADSCKKISSDSIAYDIKQKKLIGTVTENILKESFSTLTDTILKESIGTATETTLKESISTITETILKKSVRTITEAFLRESNSSETALKESIGTVFENSLRGSINSITEPIWKESISTETTLKESIGTMTETTLKESISTETTLKKSISTETTLKESISTETTLKESIGTMTETTLKESIGTSTETTLKESIGTMTETTLKESIGTTTETISKESISTVTEIILKESISTMTEPILEESIGITTETIVKESIDPVTETVLKTSICTSTDNIEEEETVCAVNKDNTKEKSVDVTTNNVEEEKTVCAIIDDFKKGIAVTDSIKEDISNDLISDKIVDTIGNKKLIVPDVKAKKLMDITTTDRIDKGNSVNTVADVTENEREVCTYSSHIENEKIIVTETDILGENKLISTIADVIKKKNEITCDTKKEDILVGSSVGNTYELERPVDTITDSIKSDHSFDKVGDSILELVDILKKLFEFAKEKFIELDIDNFKKKRSYDKAHNNENCELNANVSSNFDKEILKINKTNDTSSDLEAEAIINVDLNFKASASKDKNNINVAHNFEKDKLTENEANYLDVIGSEGEADTIIDDNSKSKQSHSLEKVQYKKSRGLMKFKSWVKKSASPMCKNKRAKKSQENYFEGLNIPKFEVSTHIGDRGINYQKNYFDVPHSPNFEEGVHTVQKELEFPKNYFVTNAPDFEKSRPSESDVNVSKIDVIEGKAKEDCCDSLNNTIEKNKLNEKKNDDSQIYDFGEDKSAETELDIFAVSRLDKIEPDNSNMSNKTGKKLLIADVNICGSKLEKEVRERNICVKSYVSVTDTNNKTHKQREKKRTVNSRTKLKFNEGKGIDKRIVNETSLMTDKVKPDLNESESIEKDKREANKGICIEAVDNGDFESTDKSNANKTSLMTDKVKPDLNESESIEKDKSEANKGICIEPVDNGDFESTDKSNANKTSLMTDKVKSDLNESESIEKDKSEANKGICIEPVDNGDFESTDKSNANKTSLMTDKVKSDLNESKTIEKDKSEENKSICNKPKDSEDFESIDKSNAIKSPLIIDGIKPDFNESESNQRIESEANMGMIIEQKTNGAISTDKNQANHTAIIDELESKDVSCSSNEKTENISIEDTIIKCKQGKKKKTISAGNKVKDNEGENINKSNANKSAPMTVGLKPDFNEPESIEKDRSEANKGMTNTDAIEERDNGVISTDKNQANQYPAIIDEPESKDVASCSSNTERKKNIRIEDTTTKCKQKKKKKTSNTSNKPKQNERKSIVKSSPMTDSIKPEKKPEKESESTEKDKSEENKSVTDTDTIEQETVIISTDQNVTNEYTEVIEELESQGAVASCSSDEKNETISIEDLAFKIRKKRHWDYTSIGNQYFRSPDSAFTFSVMSYNILNQDTLVTDFYQYATCKSDYLNERHRFESIIQEIRDHQCDIVCVQSLKSENFHKIMTVLKYFGYRGTYQKRTGRATDGCCVFWQRTKFSFRCTRCVNFNVENCPLLNSDDIGLIVSLKPLFGASVDVKVHVATTQFEFDPIRGDIKLSKLRLLFAELHKVAFIKEENDMNEYEPIILCGDFSIEPLSPLFKFIELGMFVVNSKDKTGDLSGQIWGKSLGNSVYMKRLLLDKVGINSMSCYGPETDPTIKEGKRSNGILMHSHIFMSTKRHEPNDSLTVTSIYNRMPICVDHMFHNITCTPTNNEAPNYIDGNVMLLSTLSNIEKSDMYALGQIPTAYFPSNHIYNISEFLIPNKAILEDN